MLGTCFLAANISTKNSLWVWIFLLKCNFELDHPNLTNSRILNFPWRRQYLIFNIFKSMLCEKNENWELRQKERKALKDKHLNKKSLYQMVRFPVKNIMPFVNFQNCRKINFLSFWPLAKLTNKVYLWFKSFISLWGIFVLMV